MTMDIIAGASMGCSAAMALALTLPAIAMAQASVRTNMPWRHELTSREKYDHPYADVTLQVTFTGPQHQTLSAPGVWTGGSAFTIGGSFPAAGVWTWRTACSDADNDGLNHRHGEIKVVPYEGDNPLYRHGPLKVSDNHRYLTFADGTPFLWTGDTAWIAPLRAGFDDWKTYIDDRAAKGFTVIQISPASAWGGEEDVHGNRPFLGGDLSEWNPAYWHGFEQKVRYANEKGLMVLVVGVMEPVKRYPSVPQARRFAQHLAGLLAGDQVIYSPSFDSAAGSSKQVDVIALGNAVGRTLHKAVLNSLITQHPGTDFPAVESWHDQPYLDFVGVQSGHNRLNFERVFGRAIFWIHKAYEMTPIKPVINLEALYAADGQGFPKDPPSGEAADARHTAYLSLLSGAAGITYGARGIWNWNIDREKPSFWRKAIDYPSSTQIGYLHQFFAAIPWWRLVPRPGAIPSNTRTHKNAELCALAVSNDGTLGVAYIPPHGKSVTLAMEGFKAPVSVRWFNPQTGELKSVAAKVANRGEHRFIRPAGGQWDDAVLLLETKTSVDRIDVK